MNKYVNSKTKAKTKIESLQSQLNENIMHARSMKKKKIIKLTFFLHFLDTINV